MQLNNPARQGIPIYLSLMIMWMSASVYSQSGMMSPGEIDEFSKILRSQGQVSPLDLSDLSQSTFKIYWLSPDRRASLNFEQRIAAYAGGQNTTMEYRWTWPDELITTRGEIPIVVFTSEHPWPDTLPWSSKGFRIRLGAPLDTHFAGLQLPDPRRSWMDLAAQYIFGGITLGSNGKIVTGKRVSYLPASYFGLDEEYLYQRLDSILQLGLDSAAFPGAELAIAYKGSVIYQKSVGYHTYKDIYSVRPHDLYDLASLTKVVSGVNSLMTLYDEGKFDLNKNLEDYFPYFNGSDKGALSMKRILTHSAGFVPGMGYYNMAKKKNGRYFRNTLSLTPHGQYDYAITDSIYTSQKFNKFIYKSIKESPLKPGNEYKYSGLFFLLIPDLVVNQSGLTLDTYMQKTFFDPIGAFDTEFNPTRTHPIHQIVPTEVDDYWRHQLVHGKVHDEGAAVLGGVSANAGLFSTGTDLIKIGEAWRRNGTYGGKRYWSAKTVDIFTRCYYCDEGNRRALGFDRPPLPDQPANSYMSPLASQESYGHSGFTGTMIWVDPAKEYTFVFLSNRVNPTRDNSKLYRFNIRPALHSVLYEALEKDFDSKMVRKP
ncbi:serine hydrolase [Membranicola marinus]|uniref:Serine hydrolase n=1 Tax=Membranihabitans marinus TaxID=1227546 RepID=A0A953HMH4_9BACT|nr:serine hydrolase [Membranihabitans marinus]MBY5957233.1 serine hydrolase [Membranihabitans marinus]